MRRNTMAEVPRVAAPANFLSLRQCPTVSVQSRSDRPTPAAGDSPHQPTAFQREENELDLAVVAVQGSESLFVKYRK